MQKIKVFIIMITILIASLFFNSGAEAQTGIVNPNRVYSYNQMVSDINKLKRSYPDLIQVKIIGIKLHYRNL